MEELREDALVVLDSDDGKDDEAREDALVVLDSSDSNDDEVAETGSRAD